MKISKSIVVFGSLALLVSLTYLGFGVANQSNTAQAKGKASTVKLKSEKAKLGYTVGSQIGSELVRGGVSDEIELDALLAAINDMFNGVEPRLTGEQMQQAQQAYQNKQAEKFAAIASENQAKGDKFLEANKKKKGVSVTDSGLQYEVLRAGKGKKPTAGNSVTVHYEGKLTDGTVFDSSYERKQPVDFPVTGVIPGFSEGLQLMETGAKYRFVIPAAMAYGERGSGAIGPNEVLTFDVELIEVK